MSSHQVSSTSAMPLPTKIIYMPSTTTSSHSTPTSTISAPSSSSTSSSVAGHQTTFSTSPPSTSSSAPSATTTTPTTTPTPTPTTTTSNSHAQPTPSPTSFASSAEPSSYTAHTSLSTVTNFRGEMVTQTVISTQALAPTFVPVGNATASNSSSSTTGMIAGAIVGAVAVLGVGILILWLCFRRRKRERDPFDGDFDPDRVVGSSLDRDPTLPRLDIDAAPYAYDPYVGDDGYKHADANGMPLPLHMGYGNQMAQHPNESAGFLLTSTVPSSRRPPTPPFPELRDNGTSTPPNDLGQVPSSKEWEAANERRRMYIANGGGHGRNYESEGVVQHQDGGIVPFHHTDNSLYQREIPPSYDSVGSNRGLLR